jgi:hypothetical protein
LLSPGRALVQSPYQTSRYVNADEAAEQFALDKHFLFSEFCMLLGARSVHVSELTAENTDTETKVTLAVGGGWGTAKGEVVDAARQRLSQQLSLEDTWTDAPCDVPTV